MSPGGLRQASWEQAVWARQFGKAALLLALGTWVRAQGQATGCVTRQFETGNLGTGRMGKAVGAGSLERQLWFWRLESGKGTRPGNCVCHQAVRDRQFEAGSLNTGRLGKEVVTGSLGIAAWGWQRLGNGNGSWTAATWEWQRLGTGSLGMAAWEWQRGNGSSAWSLWT